VFYRTLESEKILGFDMNGDEAYKAGGISQDFFQNKLEMGSLNIDDRKDPQLDLDKIDVQIYDSPSNEITLTMINDLYEQAGNASPPQLYNGHVVISLDRPTVNFQNIDNTEFKNKVIFVLEGSTMLSGGYFPTAPESSTLLYVKDNAYLSELQINGDFHGLIYIDKDNTKDQVIKSNNNGKIVGAIHNHSNKNIQWNGGNSSQPPVIQFSEKALNEFAKLSTGGEAGEWKAKYNEITNPQHRVRLKPLGYYFY